MVITNKSLHILLVLGCLLSLAHPQCVTLYTDYSWEGKSFQLCGSGDVPAQYNDQVSSFKVPDGYIVRLHRDYGRNGPTLGPFGSGYYDVSPDFNDQLSSISIWQSCVQLYGDYGFTGTQFTLCQSGNLPAQYNVPAQYNDIVSSLRVPEGLLVNLYRDYNYGGPVFGPYTGDFNVPSQFNDQLSSLKIAQSCVRFYTDSNLKGNFFTLCQSGDVPARYNDQVSSLAIPPGITVKLWRDYGQSGPSGGVHNEGWSNVASSFNDQLSSVTIGLKGYVSLVQESATMTVQDKSSAKKKKGKVHH